MKITLVSILTSVTTRLHGTVSSTRGVTISREVTSVFVTNGLLRLAWTRMENPSHVLMITNVTGPTRVVTALFAPIATVDITVAVRKDITTQRMRPNKPHGIGLMTELSPKVLTLPMFQETVLANLSLGT